jgi:ADP-ribosyl-[dinitrogen reductase] hydrolase
MRDIARTSLSDPLQLDLVPTKFPGQILLTLCPGKKQLHPQSGSRWNRNLAIDLELIKTHEQGGISTILTLLEKAEFDELKVPDLGEMIVNAGFTWHWLPITDRKFPKPSWFTEWDAIKGSLIDALSRGEGVLIHCMGGLGRAGTVAALLVYELGMGYDIVSAIKMVRTARGSNAIEPDQEDGLKGRFP